MPGYCWYDSRRQLSYRITHRLTQVIGFLPTHSPVEGIPNISTVQPEFDIILVIDHRILATCKPGTTIEEGKETFADHGKDYDSTKSGHGWCNARDLLHEIQVTHGYVQQ